MPTEVKFERAAVDDLPAIVELLTNDVLGQAREAADIEPYEAAFREIDADPNQLLVVGRSVRQQVGQQGGGHESEVVATLQLSILPCLTHGGTKRAQIESVRVHESMRGQSVGEAMCRWAIDTAVERGCGLIQLTTDHQRPDALRFYEKLGFVTTHHGMKLHIDE